MSVNKVLLMGNVCHTPQEFAEGKGIRFSLATNKKGYTTQEGKTIPDRTEFHNIVVFGGLVKVCRDYVRKGDKLYIEGELRYREYEGKDGAKKIAAEIYAEAIELLTPAPKTAPVEENDGLPFPR